MELRTHKVFCETNLINSNKFTILLSAVISTNLSEILKLFKYSLLLNRGFPSILVSFLPYYSIEIRRHESLANLKIEILRHVSLANLKIVILRHVSHLKIVILRHVSHLKIEILTHVIKNQKGLYNLALTSKDNTNTSSVYRSKFS